MFSSKIFALANIYGKVYGPTYPTKVETPEDFKELREYYKWCLNIIKEAISSEYEISEDPFPFSDKLYIKAK